MTVSQHAQYQDPETNSPNLEFDHTDMGQKGDVGMNNLS